MICWPRGSQNATTWVLAKAMTSAGPSLSTVTLVTRCRVCGSGLDASDPPLSTRNTRASRPARPTM